jgi:two-component system, chemotaxis family, sensor kinase CheA
MYVTHAKEGIENLNDKLLELEKNPDDQAVINECFRFAHTIKGMAATMTFKNTAELAHAMEDILDAIRSKRLGLTPEVMDLFFKCVDTMGAMTDAVKDKKPEPEAAELMKTIKKQVDALPPEPAEEEETKPDEKEDKKKAEPKAEEKKPAKPAAKKEAAPPAVEERPAGTGEKRVVGLTVQMAEGCDMPSARALVAIKRIETVGRLVEIRPPMDDIEADKFGGMFTVWVETSGDLDKLVKDVSALKGISKIIQERMAPKKEEPKPEAPVAAIPKKGATQEIASVRIKMDRLDDLLDSVGELVINKIRLSEISKGAESPQLAEALRALDRLTSELQYNVLRIRMVPIEMVFSKFPRMIRDLSKDIGKEVELVMIGQEIELDRTVIDKLGDLLVHLLRNSVDHGIEMPEERVRLGKPRIGVIRLSASQEQNRVVIKVEDDGHGIDIAKIKKKALEKGLRTEDELRNMSDDEAINILATPGFSTADKVTAISGRGVGLDAVKAGVESLGGSMMIESKKGAWTRMVIRLPLTLAIILAMLVKVGNDIYAISIDPIIETVSIKDSEIKSIGGMKVIKYRGEIVPLLFLSQLLEVSDEQLGHEAIIVEIGQKKTALVVEELLGQQEIVVKPLDKYLRKVPYLGGATILGSGEVALILDMHGLANYAREYLKRVPAEARNEQTGGGLTNG